MRPLSAASACIVLAAVASACGGSSQAEYLTQSDKAFARRQTTDADGKPGSMSLGDMRFDPNTCRGTDLTPTYTKLGPEDLVAFLRANDARVQLEQARSDLYYVTVSSTAFEPVKLRVAVLDTPAEAGRDLHEAVLEHGPGAWGVHRSNLAVLAPMGSVDQIVLFATRSRLACWGELIAAGRDDDFVIPGGYREP